MHAGQNASGVKSQSLEDVEAATEVDLEEAEGDTIEEDRHHRDEVGGTKITFVQVTGTAMGVALTTLLGARNALNVAQQEAEEVLEEIGTEIVTTATSGIATEVTVVHPHHAGVATGGLTSHLQSEIPTDTVRLHLVKIFHVVLLGTRVTAAANTPRQLGQTSGHHKKGGLNTLEAINLELFEAEKGKVEQIQFPICLYVPQIGPKCSGTILIQR